MLDEKLVLIINLAKLAAVSEYLRDRGDEHVCFVLDRIISSCLLYTSDAADE